MATLKFAHTDIREYTLQTGNVPDEAWTEIDRLWNDKFLDWPEKDRHPDGPACAWDRTYRPSTSIRSCIGDSLQGEDSAEYRLKRGRFAKRFARFVRCQYARQIPDADVSQIGNIASTHTLRGATYFVDFNRDIDWCDGDYGDGGSCYWSCHAGAKDMLRNNDAYAIRFYRPNRPTLGNGIARAWIAPIPSHCGLLWAVFNAYGIDRTDVAKVLCHIAGEDWTYRNGYLCNHGESSGALYINGGRCHFVGPKGTLADFIYDTGASYDLEWRNIRHSEIYCAGCDEPIDEDDTFHSPDGDTLCESCYDEHYTCCAGCRDSTSRDGAIEFDSNNYCPHCASVRGIVECEGCGEYADSFTSTEDGDRCDSCMESYYQCEDCGDYADTLSELNRHDELCDSCALNYRQCEDCSERAHLSDMSFDGTEPLCESCYSNRQEEEGAESC